MKSRITLVFRLPDGNREVVTVSEDQAVEIMQERGARGAALVEIRRGRKAA